jgi:hypothetical protein
MPSSWPRTFRDEQVGAIHGFDLYRSKHRAARRLRTRRRTRQRGAQLLGGGLTDRVEALRGALAGVALGRRQFLGIGGRCAGELDPVLAMEALLVGTYGLPRLACGA